jgi:hypothetical protein
VNVDHVAGELVVVGNRHSCQHLVGSPAAGAQ